MEEKLVISTGENKDNIEVKREAIGMTLINL